MIQYLLVTVRCDCRKSPQCHVHTTVSVRNDFEIVKALKDWDWLDMTEGQHWCPDCQKWMSDE